MKETLLFKKVQGKDFHFLEENFKMNKLIIKNIRIVRVGKYVRFILKKQALFVSQIAK